MSSEPIDPTKQFPEAAQGRDITLDQVIADFLLRVEHSDAADWEALYAQHPRLAEQLRAHFAISDRMENAINKPTLSATVEHTRTQPEAGTVIAGRYKLIESLGEGGMGSVWVADQKEPVKRKVAVKLIKAGMDSKQVLARFEAERQALALMDHPNIAKVFDGGMTDQGHPYFVMEYVKGIPFTDYCDGARLSLKERLELFISVCQAVQHAHHKGIVHRDLKPSNILVCLYDGKPVPKVIDFGLAKALHQQLTDHSLYTAHGVMVGTPVYMSPEQAELNNMDVDTRTDIYSLGVVLYELLTGTTPLEREQLRKAAMNEVLRLIQEIEPPKPSTRLSGSAGLPSVAAQRNIDPRGLLKSLSGDLDWIVMKSLEKERTRRYETATSLARDIERFLHEEPVEACPPSTIYRLKKYIYRHKSQVLAAGVIYTALLVSVVALSWGLHRSNEAANTVRKSLAEVTEERDAKNKALAAETEQREIADDLRDQAERRMINGILRPIGHGDEPNAAELRAFVDWAALPDNRLKLRVLEIAFENPDTAIRLARRAERVAQACVSLSPARRSNAIKILSTHQRRLDAEPRIRAAAAWLALQLDSDDLVALPDLFRWSIGWPDFSLPLTSQEHEIILALLRKRLQSLSHEQVTRCWESLISLKLPDWKSDVTFEWQVLLAQRLSPDEIKRAGDVAVYQLANGESKEGAAFGFLNLAGKLNQDQFNRGWDTLLGLNEYVVGEVLERAAHEDLALFARLNHEQIAQIWAVVVGQLETKSVLYRERPIGALAVMAERINREHPEQISHAGEVVIRVLEKMSKYRHTDMTQTVIDFKTLATYLSREQIARGWELLLASLHKSPPTFNGKRMVRELIVLADKIDPEQLSRGWNALMRIVGDDEGISPQVAGEVLVALVDRLSSEQLILSWDLLVPLVAEERNAQIAGDILVALTGRLSPDQTDRCWNELIRVLNAKHGWESSPVSEVLVALAGRLSQEGIDRGWDELIRVLEVKQVASLPVIDVLVALAGRLSQEGIDRGWDELIRVLEVKQVASLPVIDVLVALAGRLSPKQVAQAGDSVINFLESTKSEGAFVGAGRVFFALSGRLGQQQIARGWDALIVGLKNYDCWLLVEADESDIAAVVAKLGPEQIMRAWRVLIGKLEKSETFQLACKLLHCLRPKLSQEQVALSVNAVLSTLEKVDSEWVMGINGYSECLVLLAADLSSEQITRAGDAIIRVLELAKWEIDLPNNFQVDILLKLTNHDQRSRIALSLITATFGRSNSSTCAWELLAQLDHQTRNNVASAVALERLDRFAQSMDWINWDEFEHLFTVKEFIFRTSENSDSLVTLMQHPACVDKYCEWILQRFEELVLHNGERVFLPLPKDEDESQSKTSTEPTPPPRRFQNVYDAADWIEKNWPDFDLDATMPVTWRDEN